MTPTVSRSQPRVSRLAGVWSLVLLAICALAAIWLPAPAAAEPSDTPPTLVSLTFDDGFASQINAQRLLAQHNMKGTFFVPSGFIGLEARLTIEQIVLTIQADGNEIGGHTVNHLHLPMLDPAEQARQICDDRVALAHDGLTVTSFAYPYASSIPAPRRLSSTAATTVRDRKRAYRKRALARLARSVNRYLLPTLIRFGQRLL